MQDTSFDKTAETVRNGFASPHRLSGIPGEISGCLYRADGVRVDLSQRFGGYAGDHIETRNPASLPPPQAAERLPGRGLYLGHYMGGHYGHFITETLSTFWIFEQEQAQAFDYVLFHPFIFGEVTPAYVAVCLERFGIRADQVVFVRSEPLVFDEIVVPARLFRLNHSSDPRLRWVYRHITENGAAGEATPEKLYVSRRRFSQRDLFRVVANEVHVEATFRRRGFEIIYPETLPFPSQIALYSGAKLVAGISGSGLHNSLFMRDTSTIVELGDPRYRGVRSPTQVLCDNISGVRHAFIPFKGWKFNEYRVMLFDIAALETALDAILESAGPSSARAYRPPLTARLRDLLEVAYRTIRPVAGALARGILQRLRLKT